VRWKKNKKHLVGLSVSLIAVPLQYGSYVFGHLSKWFVFVLMFKFWPVSLLVNGRPTIGYNVLRIDLARALKGTSTKLRTKRSDEKLRPKRDIARIKLMRC
jgi:hypothetical protein